MIRTKRTVWFDYIRPEIHTLFAGLNLIFAKVAQTDCVITSASDGTHKIGSLHYQSKAIDIRSKPYPPDVKQRLLQEMKHLFGIRYDILLEGEGTDNEHFHIEYDPKGVTDVPSN